MYCFCKKSLEKPIVFLHGFLGTHQDWENFLPAFSHTYAFDLPGHGKSSLYSLEELYEAIPQDSHLVGYSLGGRLALQLLFSYPPKFSSLSLLSTHPGLDNREERAKRIENDKEWADLLETLPIEEFLKKWYDRPLFAKSPIPSYRKEQDPKALKEVLLAYSLGKQISYWKAIEKTTIPLLFLFGEEDSKFLPLHHRLLQLTSISTALIPKATHALPLENPKASLEKITSFLLNCSS